MDIKSFIAFAVVGAFACGVAAQDSPPAVVEAVVHVGDPAPGIPGATLAYLLSRQIDGAGNVLFSAFLEGPDITSANDQAIFYGPPGSVQKLIWESEQAPDMPEGVIIADLFYTVAYVSEDTGWITFTPRLSGPGMVPGVNDKALFVGPPGGFRKVLQGGNQAPGCEPGVYIDVESSFGFGGMLSDNATLHVVADLAGPGVTSANDRARWIGTRDDDEPEPVYELELVYRDAMPAPGCEEGVVFLWADNFAFNDAGQIAFRGGLTGPGVTSANDNGRWLGGPGALTKIARWGDPVPGMDEAVTWKIVAGGASAINGAGLVAEYGVMQGPGVTVDDDFVFHQGDSEGLDLVAREGDPAPDAGPGVYFEMFGGRWINDQGEAFYRVNYGGEGITEFNESAMYFGPLGAGRQTLRDGDPAPTFPAEVTLWRIAAVPSLTAMNDAGDIVAPTQIAGPGVTDDDKAVLWFRHGVLGRWIPLLRGGNNIDGRTVYAADEDDFGFSRPTGGADGQPQSLNDLGMLAICLEFTDGTHGIYRVAPPAFADADEDGDVDITDWLAMENCCGDTTLAPDCNLFDLDDDDDVDLADQALFQRLFQGQVIDEEGAEWGSGSAGQGGGYAW